MSTNNGGTSEFDPSRVSEALIRLRDSQGVVVEGVRSSVAFDVLCEVLIGGHDALAELARAKEVIERVRDIDYWEGNGEQLLDWVTQGYTEDGRGHKTFNSRWTPFRPTPESRP